MEVTVCPASDLPPGERKIINVNETEIVVTNVDGEYYAVSNFCPHMGGPVGHGPIESDDEETTIACPFHGWRFDLDSGKPAFPTDKKQLKTYQTTLDLYDVDVDDGVLKIEV
ncbi:Rieske (2Fe-2S) protein [Natronorubrum sp. FCH18a]|uniref:Rieske (2Fe-2S) protein n=1 Tax=Natronorubrum sp. FCH18a TaxID=3447018 RepID=UPI003F51416D